MNGAVTRRRVRLAAFMAFLPALGIASTGCLGYPTDGAVATPPPPGQQGQSRLPQLLSQLQTGSAGIELFDATPSSQVLAAQDAQGKTASSGTPGATETVAGAKTPSPTSSIPSTPTPRATATPRTTPEGSGGTPTRTPTGTLTPTSTPTASPTLTGTPTPAGTPTPTPIPTIPSESGTPTPTPVIPHE